MATILDTLAYDLGIDTSKWSGLIRWKEVFDSGLVHFVFPKATQGTLGIDTQWQNSKQGCIDYGFPFGAYHFFMPSLNAREQARHFVKTVGSGVHRYVCDVETTILAEAQKILSGSTVIGDESPSTVPELRGKEKYTAQEQDAISQAIANMLPPSTISTEGTEQATIAQMVKDFMEEVYVLTGEMGLIYTSPGFWNANVAPDWIWDMPYDLWVAHWGVPSPTIPKKWTSWVFWQYTTTLRIPGIDSYEDGNWAQTGLDLYKYFENGNPVPPPGLPDKVYVNVDKLNIRSVPDARYSSNVIGLTYMNKPWNPIAVVKGPDLNGVIRDWYQINKYGFIAAWLCRI